MTDTADLPTTPSLQEHVTVLDGVDIHWDSRVLEPRPWTVEQSRWAAELAGTDAPEGPILELCAGAGHIGLLAARASGRALVQVDVDPVACEYARANAERAGVETDVRCADLTGLDDAERFPLMVADPPWVPSAEVTRFPADPLRAIDGGEDGAFLVRACLEQAGRLLQPGGHVVLQIGSDEQLALVSDHDLVVGGRLSLVEARYFDRGVLVHLRRADEV
ncbi:class I SAM-dependent methyltransferase [Nocardioides zeae]|uniref:Class I SAM-dependent methyltransferase n=1 Tax=Nocardioides imazamoxiresistens TaxID=3231893 RepID=A0ABU3PQD0_9ACTN|nr:class I SAM-dependent methyltransferase [Nocardioides zeae]MDT9591436.1 class I SAM-dependent methyltransferase [Nocardioides zeae]